MPNRIIKESVCVSDSIDGLSWFEEVLFYRLIVNCDDFGRFDGRVAVIKNRLFPLKDGLTARNVEAAVNKLVRAGLVSLYEVDGKPFLYLPTWNDHQTMRAKKSRYPSPDDGVKTSESICKQMHADENGCTQMLPDSYSGSEPNSGSGSSVRPRRKAPERKAYGEYGNVLLTDEELEKLRREFPSHWQQLIEKLSGYMRSSGKGYRDHLATMRNWGRKDGLQGGQSAGGQLGELEKQAIARMMGGGGDDV